MPGTVLDNWFARRLHEEVFRPLPGEERDAEELATAARRLDDVARSTWAEPAECAPLIAFGGGLVSLDARILLP